MKFNPMYLLLGAFLFVGACKKAEAPAEMSAETTATAPAAEAPAQTEAQPAGQAQ